MSLEQQSPVIKDDERPLPNPRFQVRNLELRHTLAKRRVAELVAELARTRACLDEIFASRFWRWTSPIRSAVRALRSALQSVQRLGRRVCSVVTPIAAEGLHLVDGENSLIADDPPAFAAVIERLYRSEPLWLELSQNGRNTIEKRFSVEAVARELDRLIDDAGLGHSSHGLHARRCGLSPNHLERIRL